MSRKATTTAVLVSTYIVEYRDCETSSEDQSKRRDGVACPGRMTARLALSPGASGQRAASQTPIAL